MTVDLKGKFAYVTNVDGNNVFAYTLDAISGVLTAVAGSPFRSGVPKAWRSILRASSRMWQWRDSSKPMFPRITSTRPAAR